MIRKKYADYEDLKKAKGELDQLKQGQMTEVERLKSDLEKSRKESEGLSAQLKTLTLTALKNKVAVECGIPLKMADRLSGETEEDLRKDAEAMKPFFRTQGAVGGGGVPGGANGNAEAGDDKGAYGRKLAQSALKTVNHSKKQFFEKSKNLRK